MTPKRGEFYRRREDGEIVMVTASGKLIVRATAKSGRVYDWCPPYRFAQECTGPVAVDWVERAPEPDPEPMADVIARCQALCAGVESADCPACKRPAGMGHPGGDKSRPMECFTCGHVEREGK